MKKGRHRRYEQARETKRAGSGTELGYTLGEPATGGGDDELCVECGRSPHADWCMAAQDDDFDDAHAGCNSDHSQDESADSSSR